MISFARQTMEHSGQTHSTLRKRATSRRKRFRYADSALFDAMENRTALHVTYRGNARKVIPLVFGRLKNGKEAVLCYKIVEDNPGEPTLLIRLYHWEYLDILSPAPLEADIDFEIRYYLTRHFATVYGKV